MSDNGGDRSLFLPALMISCGASVVFVAVVAAFLWWLRS